MPPIPTIMAERDIYTGSTGPQADPNDFAPSFHGLETGLHKTAEVATHLIGVSQAVENKKKDAIDNRWTTESVMQERMHLSEWMSDPKNNQSEEFSNQFKDYAQQRIKSYQSSAPSPKAADAFQAHMGDWVSRQYDNALQTTEKTRLNNTIVGLDNSISDTLKSFRDAQGTPNNTALIDLEDNFHFLHDSIEKQFGDVSPGIAAKLQSHLVKEAVMGIMPTDPTSARRILDSSNVVDEETRKSLLTMIKQSEESRDIVAEDQFSRDRRDHLASVFFGKTEDKIPLGVYGLYYPKDKATVLKAHDDAIIDTYVGAGKVMTSISGKNASAQVATLSDISGKASTEHDKDVLEILEPKIRQNLQQMQRDRVSWMISSNPRVEAAQRRVEVATDPGTKQAMTAERNNLILQYQGNPPSGTPAEERDYYLGLPSSDRHLMGAGEAAGYAAQINKSSPAEAVQAINKVISAYPDPAHQYIAFNDLVHVPKTGEGLRQDYQLAFQNRGAWWVDTYTAAIANTKEVATLDDDRRKDILKEIEANPKWKQFQQAMIGDNFDRAKEIEGFRSGILTYSHALSMGGKSLKDSTRSSVDMLIGETLGFATVNGQSIAIAKELPGKHDKRTDAEVGDIGRRLGVALQYIDPREVDPQHFTNLPKDLSRVEDQQKLRDIITARGFFVTGNDGQSASLHMRDDHGFPFEISTKDGLPFTIHFDDLPNFTTMVPTVVYPSHLSGGPGISGSHAQGITPQKTYDLQSGTGVMAKLFNIPTRTNWPAQVPWIKHPVRQVPIPTTPLAPVSLPPAEDPLTSILGDTQSQQQAKEFYRAGTPPDDR